MRNIALVIILFVLVCFTSGCIYSSANLLRAQGKEINVLGAWGWVKCNDASVTLYRSTDAISYPKNINMKYPKVPTRPTIQEEAESSTLNIGKPTVLVPKVTTPDADTTPAIAEVAKTIITK